MGTIGRLLGAAAVCAACAGAPEAPPDVVLITLDTTRADHLGAYGYARNTTPELDRFARESVVYRRTWSTASWTLPAHASLLTGLHPTSHGAHFAADGGDASLAAVIRGAEVERRAAEQIQVNRLGPESVTLAELLRDAGYATAAFAGGPWLAPEFGLLQGYDHVDAEVRGLAGRRARDLTDAALAWLAHQDPARPLHLLVNYFDPHRPYDPPRGFDGLPGAELPLRVDPDSVNRGEPLPPEQRRAYLARYDGEIQYMDHHLGRLLAALRAAGRLERALVVVTADHGESFGEHGLMEHGRWLYEEVLRVPLIVRFPGGRYAGRSVVAPVSLVDVLPLVAAELGLALPAHVEGLLPGSRDLVIAESFRDRLAIRSFGPRFDRDLVAAIRWPWKRIQSDSGTAELYQLDADPAELSNQTGHADEEPALAAALDAVRKGWRAPVRRPARADPDTLERLRSLGYVE